MELFQFTNMTINPLMFPVRMKVMKNVLRKLDFMFQNVNQIKKPPKKITF